jgi:hypothetical protein
MDNNRELEKRHSRRIFIKYAALGIGVTALAQVSSRNAAAVQAIQVPGWYYEAGIVILGAGGAGLMTAITAQDKGAGVLILGKAPEAHAGGNTGVSGQRSWCAANLSDSIISQKDLSDGYPNDRIIQMES